MCSLRGPAISSHINQVMRNFAAGASPKRPALKEYVDADGKLSMVKLQAVDKEMYDHVRKGLFWEVLRSDIDVEAPNGAALIQVAFMLESTLALQVCFIFGQPVL